MSNKPVLYFNDATSTRTGGDYSIKLLRRSKAESDDEEKVEAVGELYMSFSTAVHLRQILNNDVPEYLDTLAEALGLDGAQLRSKVNRGKDVGLLFLDPLKKLLND